VNVGPADQPDGLPAAAGQAALDAVRIAEAEQVADVALSAPRALIEVVDDVVFARGALQAVRGQEQQVPRRHAHLAEPRDPVVEPDEKLPHDARRTNPLIGFPA